MGTETYPKPSKNPSVSVGNQKTPAGWDRPNGTSYPGVGASGTKLNTERAETLVCSGGSGSANKSDYPGDWRTKFGSEKYEASS